MVGDGEHVVQFYEREADLVRAVGTYLISAVAEDAVAIVIAGEAHRVAFEAELVGTGIDVVRATEEGRVVWLDAARTLSLFMEDGRIEPARFRDVVGGVVRWARGTGRPVRAYGEMVALLWDAGDILGAIELEKLWNDLGRELSFALWCGYHTRSVAGAEHAEALHEVCQLHSAVMPDAAARFHAGADAPRAARRFVMSTLERSAYGERVSVDDVQLVVSELATNAVIHAGSAFSVSVRCADDAIRIAVQDWSSTWPQLRGGSPAARSGRGLHLVGAVAREWGVEPAPDGKTVWAELPLR
ncbi:MAG: MEDS domain-containing protein [Solirubrobacterales bacterium]|nr:MEDS domain-containing protein [Solirubrobacterales bacterium]MBV9809969.1 MEDS domain-containing protein [Solirubrobacterales bacterium]